MKPASFLFFFPLLAALCLGATAPANPFGFDVVRVSPRVAVVHGDPWNNAELAIATRKGIVVICSSWSESIGRGIRSAIQNEFKRADFAYLIDSHEHSDHIGGNGAFVDLPIVAHASVRQAMVEMAADPKTRTQWAAFSAEKEIAKMHDYYTRQSPGYLETPAYAGCVACYRAMEQDFHGAHALVLPTITFDRRLTLDLGDLTIRLTYFGGLHSLGDTIISIPEENLVSVGQLFFAGRMPVLSKNATPRLTPAMVDNWFVVLREILRESDENTRFMTCSQRDFMKKQDCERFTTYLERLWTGLKRAHAEGKTQEQARTEGAFKEHFADFAQWPNESNRGTEWEVLDLHQRNLDQLWDVLTRASQTATAAAQP